MNFQDLSNHFSQNGCTLDHIEENRYTAMNCISSGVCEIEDLEEYSDVTLCHYFFELGIPAVASLRNALDEYRKLREHIKSVSVDPKMN